MPATPWAALAYIVGIAVVVIILGFAAVVVWRLITTKGVLDGLIAEPTDAETVTALTKALQASNPNITTTELNDAIRSTGAKASLSRFQFLIFTFVVAGLFLLLSIEAGAFVEVPPTVLGLIGLSGGSFVISKGISNSSSK
jgi:hypothetical protein